MGWIKTDTGASPKASIDTSSYVSVASEIVIFHRANSQCRRLINALKSKLVFIIFKHSLSTSTKTQFTTHMLTMK